MLKAQQEQLNQLTKSMSVLKGLHQHGRSAHHRAVVCRRCLQLGHFSQECEGGYMLLLVRSSICLILNSVTSSPAKVS